MGGALSTCLGPDSHALAIEAVRRGDDKLLLVLLTSKGGGRVKINERNPQHEGFTLLGEAASLGHNRVVKLLLERGATMDVTTDGGFTPLTLALRGGHDGVASVLINSGAGLDYSDSAYGKTALLWAVENKTSASVIKLLTDKGCNLDVKSRQGLTALMLAADANNADVVRVLLNAGANPRAQDHRGGTALSRAKERGFNVVAGLLADAVAALDRKEKGAAAGGAGGAKSRSGSSAGVDEEASRSGKKLWRKAALGSQATDLFAGGRATAAEGASKDRMKGKTFASASLDSSLGGRR